MAGDWRVQWFFPDGTFEWRRVSVLEEEPARFLIEWEGNGKQKWVSTLNILFEGEEEDVLDERRHTAILNRCAARQNMALERWTNPTAQRRTR